MIQSVAVVNTDKASIYLKKFCRHFAHKLTVEFDDHNGSVEFPFGDCTVVAQGEELTLSLSANSVENIDRAEQVAGSHMERFAAKDELKVVWQRR
jgi:hypothetical protein